MKMDLKDIKRIKDMYYLLAIEIDELYDEAYILMKEKNDTKDVGDYCKGLLLYSKAYIKEKMMYHKLKKMIIELGICNANEIAVDQEELIRKRGKAKVVIDSIAYDETMPLICLKNLVMACSDIDLLLLPSEFKLENLDCVLGDILTTQLSSFNASKLLGAVDVVGCIDVPTEYNDNSCRYNFTPNEESYFTAENNKVKRI